MSAEAPAPKGKPKGKIQFLENHWPSLPAGDYTIAVTQTIAASSTTGTPVPSRALSERSFHAAEREFSVLGPRFSLDPAMIRTVFPPPGSLGEHSSVLPHITFTRSTLPWERQPRPLSEHEDATLALRARVELFEELLSEKNKDALKQLKGKAKNAKEAIEAGAQNAKETLAASARQIIYDYVANKEPIGLGEQNENALKALKEKVLKAEARKDDETLADGARRAIDDYLAKNESIEKEILWQVLHAKKETPWLALLLFDQDEIDEKEGVDTKDALIRTCTLASNGNQFVLHSTADAAGGVESPSFDLEMGQQAGDPVMVLEVKRDLLDKILPSLEETRWLAHARRATDEDDHPISEELATLLCNRLPRPGRMSIVHLVSLEGHYGQKNLWEAVADPGNERIRLVSLKSWRFACVAEEHSFKGLLHNLDFGGRRIASGEVHVAGPAQPVAPTYRVPGGFDTGRTPTTLCIPDEGRKKAGPYLRRGYVAVPHQMRDGNQSVSWFHGPLAPGEAVNTDQKGSERWQLPEGTLPARSADQLVRYFPDCGMFDVSYSAAWELGRLLTLQNRSVAIDLLDWKRRHRHRQEQETARRELAHLPIQGQRADATLPPKVTNWFHGISLLKGVPFNYLVPDERMLPQESLRFFWIDASWVRCLLDGAFSVGRALPSDFKRDKSHENKPHAPAHAKVTGFLLRSQVVSGWPDLQVDGYGERLDDDNYERPEKEVTPPIRSSLSLATAAEASELARRLDAGDVMQVREKFGFLDGQDLVLGPYEADASLPNKSQTQPAAWVVNKNEEIYLIRRHDNQFTVKRENKLQRLRMTRLSKNVLLCLFAGEVSTVDIHQKPEALHFGVNRSGDKPPECYRRLKTRTASESKETVKIHWKSDGYDLELMSVATTNDVLDEGRRLVIVALVGDELHIRIFDDSGEKVVDKAENELMSGDALTALKQRLNSSTDESRLSEKEKQEIIGSATSSAGHTQSEEEDSGMRVIGITQLVADMKESKECQSFGEFTAAQFALQMVEGVQKVRFLRTK